MAVIVDLDDRVKDPHSDSYTDLEPLRPVKDGPSPEEDQDERPNPNINGFSAALSCYPIVSELAKHLDLNSLHDLSRTCRQFRVNLLQYRNQLVTQTLHCANEDASPSPAIRGSQQNWNANGRLGHFTRLTSGKVGRCARDMVGECRRCGTVICRNCTIKPPPVPALKGRHRRLCRKCQKVPLSWHTSLFPRANTFGPEPPSSFTFDSFIRGPCTCEEVVWLCQSCGHSVRNNDGFYIRGWEWRTRYSTYLGGLGTGIGEGNEGVECGRGGGCLGAKEVEHEIDCETEEAFRREIEEIEAGGRGWGGSSYLAQEIEGIGGVVKRKLKKRVKVGAVVREHEEERNHGGYLERERQGLTRSWCAWCNRVIASKKDLERPERPSSSASSSTSTSSGS